MSLFEEFEIPDDVESSLGCTRAFTPNEACPRFITEVGALWVDLWVDRKHPSDREDPECHRFSVTISGNDDIWEERLPSGWRDYSNIAETDDWEYAKAWYLAVQGIVRAAYATRDTQ